MDISATQTNEEIRAQIVAKLRSALKLDPDAKIPTSSANEGLEKLRAQILEKVRASTGLSSLTSNSKASGYEIDVTDMRTRMLFYRIKNANIAKQQRDALSGFVRSMAVENKIDNKAIKSVSEMIFVMEMSSSFNKEKEFSTFPIEKSVNDEMDYIYKLRSQRNDMKERMTSLAAQFA